jgi:hypothetical protein
LQKKGNYFWENLLVGATTKLSRAAVHRSRPIQFLTSTILVQEAGNLSDTSRSSTVAVENLLIPSSAAATQDTVCMHRCSLAGRQALC